MAKIYIRPNPNINPLMDYVKIEEKRTLKDKKSGLETTSSENVTSRFHRAPGTSFRICANPSRSLAGNLNSGMLYEIPNPFKDHNTFHDKRFEAVLMGKDKALVQHILEFKWNKPFNYLTNQTINPLEVKEVKDIPALQQGEYTLELEDGVTILDTDTEFGEIMYYIVKANSLVANSYEELTGNTPFYISHEAEEEQIKAKRELQQDKAIAKLVELFDNTPEVLVEFAKALDLRKLSNNHNTNYNELKGFAKRAKENAIQFLTMFSMYSEEATKSEFKARVLLYDARKEGFIIKDGASYTWNPPADENGDYRAPLTFDRFTGENSIIEFLSHPKFAREQKELSEQIDRANRFTKK